MKDVLRNNSWADITTIAQAQAQVLRFPWNQSVQVVLKACYDYPDLSPSRISGSGASDVLKKWIRKFKKGYEGRISRRVSNPPGTIPDPIIDIIINGRLSDLSQIDLEKIKYAHRLSILSQK
jgi:hypothetical protein